MKGVGERITPIELPRIWYVVVYPDVAISTAEVYRGLRIVLTKEENDDKFSGNFHKLREVADILENDLEEVAASICPEIKTIKERLKEARSLGSLMSGSGSAFFGILETKEVHGRAQRR